ncbi:DUF5333 family protein [Jannaschia aquimarina]|uniref:Lipoprotein n=1 Tax=Jannaschia aquimarina TaxID=935700 RepID=A0A0D1CM49_9RHOB|nr:DUF5333 family protein [Jannaschia aquimarina]KIT15812.1 hypothetical protein jaqu_23920 [Jannaschia aquimarina]SNT09186.1 hypothetical protein SAMN05421775_105207 [Jannaschia aquimarina]
MRRRLNAGAILAAFFLAACQTSGPADPRVLQQTTRQFGIDLALASLAAENCGDLRLIGGSTEAASRQYVEQMLARGYSPRQIGETTAAIDEDEAGREAIAYLEDRGVTPGDTARLCTVARGEVAAGTRFGRYLRAT